MKEGHEEINDMGWLNKLDWKLKSQKREESVEISWRVEIFGVIHEWVVFFPNFCLYCVVHFKFLSEKLPKSRVLPRKINTQILFNQLVNLKIFLERIPYHILSFVTKKNNLLTTGKCQNRVDYFQMHGPFFESNCRNTNSVEIILI